MSSSGARLTATGAGSRTEEEPSARLVARRRVLIVTSTYAPAMIADMQRARMLAWELPDYGWDVEILCPGSSFQHPSCIEGDSACFFADCGVVHQIAEIASSMFRMFGMRTIGWRSLWPLHQAGLHLLRSGRFDLVFFTTTQFNLFVLGPLWRATTGVPYVLDFHDPWHKSDVQYETSRHRVKLKMASLLARGLEPPAVRHAAGLIAVSPEYLDTLSRRYRGGSPAWLTPGRHATIPFAGSERDFKLPGPRRTTTTTTIRDGSALRLVYVGAGGHIMERGFALLCQTVRSLIDHGNPHAARLRIELHGTILGWLPTMGRHLQDVALGHGLEGIVSEHPERVSYARSIELLSSADGTLVLGVDDRGYMPSKLFGYALSGKPLLACLRHGSPAWQLLNDNPMLGRVLAFGDAGADQAADVRQLVAAHLRDMADGRVVDRRGVLRPFLAHAMAGRVAELFSACVQSVRPPHGSGG